MTSCPDGSSFQSDTAATVLIEERQISTWIEVLESCLPTDEGYDDDTAQVLANVIRSLRTVLR